MVERIWKRDGTVNIMSTEVAVRHLHEHYPKMPLDTIVRRLRLGQVFETPHARLRLVHRGDIADIQASAQA